MTAPRQPDPEHTKDKFGLFALAGLVVIVLGGVVVGTFVTQGVPDKGDVLLGGIATGLILFLRDLVSAVRSSWEEVTRGKTLETVANSAPVDSSTTPADAVEAAEEVAHAAEDKADEIKEKGT